MCQLTQQERFYDDYDPQVDLEVKGFMIPQVDLEVKGFMIPQVDLEVKGFMITQVVVDFGSQVHILPKEV
jgi:hypothetical protein